MFTLGPYLNNALLVVFFGAKGIKSDLTKNIFVYISLAKFLLLCISYVSDNIVEKQEKHIQKAARVSEILPTLKSISTLVCDHFGFLRHNVIIICNNLYEENFTSFLLWFVTF